MILSHKPLKHFFKWLPTVFFLLFFVSLTLFFVTASWGHFTASNSNVVSIFVILKMASLGLALALLASLLAWPLALSIVILLEQNKGSSWMQGLKSATRFLSTLPLIFFVYLYVEVIGSEVFYFMEDFWTSYLTPNHIITQVVAFALTLLLYPLRVLPGVGASLTIDEFFRQMVLTVVEFAEVGLAVSLLSLGLIFYILPRMVVTMLSEIQESNKGLSFEVVQSLGGSRWEGTQMTVLQLMRQKSVWILISFTRLCFFEGLITFSLLHFFLFRLGHKGLGEGLASRYIGDSLFLTSSNVQNLSSLGGAIFVSFLLLFSFEILFKRASRSDDV